MIKTAIFVACVLSLANAQTFPVKAAAIVGGGILNPQTQEPIMVMGKVDFIQETAASPVTLFLNITFFPDNIDIVKQPRGFHIHEFGITELNQDPAVMCGSAGGHWNPLKSQHPTHAGDLGNVVITPVNGRILTKLTSSRLQLSGVESIIGRSVVLHEKTDDLGKGTNEASKTNGNAGSRIACGTIGYVKP